MQFDGSSHDNRNLSMDPNLSQKNVIHAVTKYFTQILSNIILSYNPNSPEWSHSLGVSKYNFVCISHVRPLAQHSVQKCAQFTNTNNISHSCAVSLRSYIFRD